VRVQLCEVAFATAWAEGKTLPTLEIIAEALEEAPAAAGLIVAADTARLG
jgi:hypothetical protein